MKADYGSMGRAELESALRRLRAELEDLEETVGFNYSFTSAHISGGKVRKDEDALRAPREEIEEVTRLLAVKNGRIVSPELRPGIGGNYAVHAIMVVMEVVI